MFVVPTLFVQIVPMFLQIITNNFNTVFDSLKRADRKREKLIYFLLNILGVIKENVLGIYPHIHECKLRS